MTTSGITVFGQPSQPNHGAGGRIAMDDAVFPTDYVALDLETTGFYPNSCAITEIGAVRVRETGFDIEESSRWLMGFYDDLLGRPAPHYSDASY